MKNDFLYNNYLFSKLNKNDLDDILAYCSNYLLEYRDSLNLDKDMTFGVEIEYENLLLKRVSKFIDNRYCDWSSRFDGSLHKGGEVISPIMKDDNFYWKELSEICGFLRKKRATSFGNAGGHIHVGASYLNNDVKSWLLFFKLYASYEYILYRYSFGDKNIGRQCIDTYAKSISNILKRVVENSNNVSNVYELFSNIPRKNRNYSVNFRNVFLDFIDKNIRGNTVEFRLPNATFNEIIWQNNINVFCKMLMSCKNKKIDEDFLDYKLKNEFISYDEVKFKNIIDYNSVFEFVDLVFNNNKDKIYFLRQYLRNNRCNSVKSKKFTR